MIALRKKTRLFYQENGFGVYECACALFSGSHITSIHPKIIRMLQR